MLAKVQSVALRGLSAVPVTVEVDVSSGGLPGLTIVGLPDATVKEAKERLRSAIRNSQFAWPQTRTTISLAPADLRKEGSAFDLSMALGVLGASGQLPMEGLSDTVILGELALDGTVRWVTGVLPIALSLRGTGKRLLLPVSNAPEAAWVEGISVYPLQDLRQTVDFLKKEIRIASVNLDPRTVLFQAPHHGVDFAEVKGQVLAKRAIEVAVAGGHNLLLMGPPGVGKSMLAERIPTVMPELTLEEALEVTAVYSVMGLLPPGQALLAQRPFRSPHQTISDAGLIGGGTIPKPGEISLAHHGVLFLDELPEFSRQALESLRQPLEEGAATISRVHGTTRFPARVMLMASMNPCPCGMLGSLTQSCLCSAFQIHRYRARISGPLLDRIDLHLEVPALSVGELTQEKSGEPSAVVRARVQEARNRQRQRFSGEPGIWTNARMRHRHLKEFCRLDDKSRELLKRAIVKLKFSARAYDKLLKVSRTIADLSGSQEIQTAHLAEAIQYRVLDRTNWGQP